MAYDETLAERVSQALAKVKKVEAKQMMGGLTFMVNAKMCLGIIKDGLLVRIDPNDREKVLKIKGCRIMDFTGRPMKGFVVVDPVGTKSEKDLAALIRMALDYNKVAKAAKKRKTARKPAD